MYRFTGEYLNGNHGNPPNQTDCTCNSHPDGESLDWEESLKEQEDRKLDGSNSTGIQD